MLVAAIHNFGWLEARASKLPMLVRSLKIVLLILSVTDFCLRLVYGCSCILISDQIRRQEIMNNQTSFTALNHAQIKLEQPSSLCSSEKGFAMNQIAQSFTKIFVIIRTW